MQADSVSAGDSLGHRQHTLELEFPQYITLHSNSWPTRYIHLSDIAPLPPHCKQCSSTDFIVSEKWQISCHLLAS